MVYKAGDRLFHLQLQECVVCDSPHGSEANFTMVKSIAEPWHLWYALNDNLVALENISQLERIIYGVPDDVK